MHQNDWHRRLPYRCAANDSELAGVSRAGFCYMFPGPGASPAMLLPQKSAPIVTSTDPMTESDQGEALFPYAPSDGPIVLVAG
ncbi:MAG TPA: hypothetical protein VG537_09820 [Candidatus Kapabacteria bacterium]|nr:hypothetical protein [Candidatus Kapabacteria bacterium]